MPKRSANGLRMPDDFETVSYKAVRSRIDPFNTKYPTQWPEYIGAWIAITYRFYACTEYDRAFTKSVRKYGTSLQDPERYYQERDLFGFFVNGLAAVESTYYGLFAIASMLDAVNFPIATDEEKRVITTKRTAEKFCDVFPKESISMALEDLIGEQAYKDWGEQRNILAHRQSPGRTHFVGGASHGTSLWSKGITIDASTTFTRRSWLASEMQTLLREAESFTSKYF